MRSREGAGAALERQRDEREVTLGVGREVVARARLDARVEVDPEHLVSAFEFHGKRLPDDLHAVVHFIGPVRLEFKSLGDARESSELGATSCPGDGVGDDGPQDVLQLLVRHALIRLRQVVELPGVDVGRRDDLGRLIGDGFHPVSFLVGDRINLIIA